MAIQFSGIQVLRAPITNGDEFRMTPAAERRADELEKAAAAFQAESDALDMDIFIYPAHREGRILRFMPPYKVWKPIDQDLFVLQRKSLGDDSMQRTDSASASQPPTQALQEFFEKAKTLIRHL